MRVIRVTAVVQDEDGMGALADDEIGFLRLPEMGPGSARASAPSDRSDRWTFTLIRSLLVRARLRPRFALPCSRWQNLCSGVQPSTKRSVTKPRSRSRGARDHARALPVAAARALTTLRRSGPAPRRKDGCSFPWQHRLLFRIRRIPDPSRCCASSRTAPAASPVSFAPMCRNSPGCPQGLLDLSPSEIG